MQTAAITGEVHAVMYTTLTEQEGEMEGEEGGRHTQLHIHHHTQHPTQHDLMLCRPLQEDKFIVFGHQKTYRKQLPETLRILFHHLPVLSRGLLCQCQFHW